MCSLSLFFKITYLLIIILNFPSEINKLYLILLKSKDVNLQKIITLEKVVPSFLFLEPSFLSLL